MKRILIVVVATVMAIAAIAAVATTSFGSIGKARQDVTIARPPGRPKHSPSPTTSPSPSPSSTQSPPPTGFTSETVWKASADDWEPAIATDPSSNYVYEVTTRYGDRACAKCQNAGIVYRVSSDNGDTWGPVGYLCKCKGAAWQADPQIEVADTGTVYATILQQWHTYLVTSTDHGQTWSAEKDVAPPGSLPYKFTDHGFLTISPDGQDVYGRTSNGDLFNMLRDPQQPLLMLVDVEGLRELGNARPRARRKKKKT
jgi:hypothetical protein